MNTDQDSTSEIKVKWYYKPWVVICILLNIGPLGLPFLYLSPKFSKKSKYVITVIMIFVTYWIIVSSINAYHLLANPEEMKIFLDKYLNEEQKQLINMYMTGDIGF